MARVLVTGAGGYIGQHLCLALARDNWQVRGLGRSKCPEALAGMDWVEGDITLPDVATRSVEGCRYLIHLACLPLAASAQDPVQALRMNVEGTIRILEAVRQLPMERLVFASSGQVYGGQSALPNAETDGPAPDSPYAASKLSAEIWCQASARAFGVPVQILRLFNVYGADVSGRLRPTVETLFLQRLAHHQAPQIRGNPSSGRDFVHISDVVSAMARALQAPVDGLPVNVGSGVLTSLTQLADTAAHVMGSHREPEILESPEMPVRFQADTARAQKLLGWQASTSLADGLRDLAGRL